MSQIKYVSPEKFMKLSREQQLELLAATQPGKIWSPNKDNAKNK